MLAYCLGCTTAYAVDLQFCPHCGSRSRTYTKPEPAPATKPTPKPPKKTTAKDN